MRFCMSSGEDAEPAEARFFLRLPGVAYVHDDESPRLVQLSQGWPRLHFSLRSERQRRHRCMGKSDVEEEEEEEGEPQRTFGAYRVRRRAGSGCACGRREIAGLAATGPSWMKPSMGAWAS